MSLLARLGVVLGLNSTEFTQGLDQATNKTREFEINQKRALKNAQKAQDDLMANVGKGALAITGLALAVGKVFQYGDQIDETAKGFDVTTKAIVAMQGAFQDSGGQIDDASGALQKLAIAQQNAKDGNDAMRESFKKLGISGKDVEELNLEDLFKRVAQELSKMDDSTQRVALQTEILGKAVKGTNWKDFVSNYKELGDPALVHAIEENAKAWGNIEANFREILLLAQKMVYPFALIVNHISDIRKEFQRLKKEGADTEIDFGAAFGGMPGEAIVGSYGEAKSDIKAKPIAKDAKEGDYKAQTDKQKAEAKKAADEAKRLKESREQMKLDIDLIRTKAKIAGEMFAVDSKGIVLGQEAISQEKMLLDLANSIAEIRTNATKERAKDKAQVDLINQKEQEQIAARVAEFGFANGLRMQQREREHKLAMQFIEEEGVAQRYSYEIAAHSSLDLLEVEKERFELGNAAYELKKLEVEKQIAIRDINASFYETIKQVTKEYDLSAKSAMDLELLEQKIEQAKRSQLVQLNYLVSVEDKRKEVLKEQIAIEDRMFKLDLAQQKGRDIANIQAGLQTNKQILDLESRRYFLSQNAYNLQNLELQNINRLIEAEKKYTDQQKEAYYEMQRQGGGQLARERYEERIKSITEVRDIELEAIKQVNDARTRNAEADVMRQKSFTEGWEYAARRFREDAENAFNRGEAAFGAVMSNMNAAIGNFVETGKFAFEDFAVAVIKDLIRMEMQAQATMLFRMILGSFGGMSLSSTNVDAGITANVGMAAAGGTIDGPTIVGENGPELFVPSQRGTVIPNTIAPSMAGMGQPQVVYNGPYIENMSAIDTQSASQFLSKNKMSVWAANKSADRSVPVSR
jgi:lambda family phage tail tape measure protein